MCVSGLECIASYVGPGIIQPDLSRLLFLFAGVWEKPPADNKNKGKGKGKGKGGNSNSTGNKGAAAEEPLEVVSTQELIQVRRLVSHACSSLCCL